MGKTVLEKISEGIEVSKDECVRSLAAHMSGFRSLLERFENDIKLFVKAPDETLKKICNNSITACQDKQTMVNEMTEQLIVRLDENNPDDKVTKDEAEKKRTDCATKLSAAKLEFIDNLAKYNTEKAKKEKDQIENQENQVVRGSSSVVTAEVKLSKLSLNLNMAEFIRWVIQAEFYADAYLVHDKLKKIQQQMLLQHLDLTLQNMLSIMLTDQSDFKEGLERLKEIFDNTYPLYTRRWRHMRMKQKQDEDFLAWKARHYISFVNAKMTEMNEEDHMVLSLLLGTKEGKIKSKITSKSNPTMKEVEEIARSEMCIASIKDQTGTNPNERAYRAEGAIKKECNRCRDTTHLARKCTKKLWCEACKDDRHTFGAWFCKSKDKDKRDNGDRRRYRERGKSYNNDRRGRSPSYGGDRDRRGRSPSYGGRRRSPGRYRDDRYRSPSAEGKYDSARRVKDENDRRDRPSRNKDDNEEYGDDERRSSRDDRDDPHEDKDSYDGSSRYTKVERSYKTTVYYMDYY